MKRESVTPSLAMTPSAPYRVPLDQLAVSMIRESNPSRSASVSIRRIASINAWRRSGSSILWNAICQILPQMRENANHACRSSHFSRPRRERQRRVGPLCDPLRVGSVPSESKGTNWPVWGRNLDRYNGWTRTSRWGEIRQTFAFCRNFGRIVSRPLGVPRGLSVKEYLFFHVPPCRHKEKEPEQAKGRRVYR